MQGEKSKSHCSHLLPAQNTVKSLQEEQITNPTYKSKVLAQSPTPLHTKERQATKKSTAATDLPRELSLFVTKGGKLHALRALSETTEASIVTN